MSGLLNKRIPKAADGIVGSPEVPSGMVGKNVPRFLSERDKNIQSYKDAAHRMDSLRTNYLTPALLKKAGASELGPSIGNLTPEEFKAAVGGQAGVDMWTRDSQAVSPWQRTTQVAGTNEAASTPMSSTLYGYRMASHKWHNPEFVSSETRAGVTKEYPSKWAYQDEATRPSTWEAPSIRNRSTLFRAKKTGGLLYGKKF
jgi:hypothetical protein